MDINSLRQETPIESAERILRESQSGIFYWGEVTRIAKALIEFQYENYLLKEKLSEAIRNARTSQDRARSYGCDQQA